MKYTSHQQGVSALEILLVIAVVAIILVVTTPALISFRKNQAIQNSANSVVSLLQEARAKTLASYNNTFYSVYFDTDRAVLFVGGTYSSSDSTNKVLLYESPVALQGTSLSGGGSQVSFDRLKGTTSQSGTIVLEIPSGATKTITVSANGVISRN